MIPWKLDRPAWVMRALSQFSRPTATTAHIGKPCACGCGKLIDPGLIKYGKRYYDRRCAHRAWRAK